MAAIKVRDGESPWENPRENPSPSPSDLTEMKEGLRKLRAGQKTEGLRASCCIVQQRDKDDKPYPVGSKSLQLAGMQDLEVSLGKAAEKR